MLNIRFADAAAPAAEALAVGIRPGKVFEPGARLADVEGLVTRTLAGRHRFGGDGGDVLPVLTAAGWLVLVGLGEARDQNAGALRRIGGGLFAELADTGVRHLHVALDLAPGDAAEVAYGMLLRAWRPPARYKSHIDPGDLPTLGEVTLVCVQPAAAEARFARLQAPAAGAALARDLVVAPGNELNPASFAERLKMLEGLGVAVDILDAARHGLSLLEAVGQGSVTPPRLAVLRWSGGRAEANPLVLVGKGITFDSGGIDIKPAEDMAEMKGDMAGGAAVVGTIQALAMRRARANVTGIVALAENMPSGRAARPGDVVRGFGGTTVEIIDTDAEGRLVLADGLAYAGLCNPAAMIDLATLTGAVEVALGRHRAGLFCTDDHLAERLLAAGEAEEERLWRLPLTDVYDEALQSPVADLRNCSWEHGPDAMHAARFLQHFIPGGVPWAHLDIAGVTEAEDDEALTGEGPTGFGVRLLDRLIADAYEG